MFLHKVLYRILKNTKNFVYCLSITVQTQIFWSHGADSFTIRSVDNAELCDIRWLMFKWVGHMFGWVVRACAVWGLYLSWQEPQLGTSYYPKRCLLMSILWSLSNITFSDGINLRIFFRCLQKLYVL